MAFSDHLNYWKFRIPSVMITSGAFLFNSNYHTEMDCWDTLDYNKMELLVRQLKKLLEKQNENN